jgi:hypothetical protein
MGCSQSETSTTQDSKGSESSQDDPLVLPPGDEFLTRGFLLRHRVQLVALLVIVLATASLLSFFVKPHGHLGELVTPDQELPGFELVYHPDDSDLSRRVTSSYSLAFVLFSTPYTATNLRALENIRSWAQNRFEESPNFLHPVSMKGEQEPNDTVIGALGYNLFANIKYFLETEVGLFLRSRIAEFHNDPAYDSFSNSYFEIYGKDLEAATLLARYQSDRAKGSIDVILWTLGWTVALILAGFSVALSPRRQRFERIRQALVLVWTLAALGYSCSAWMSNSIPAFMSALLSGACVFYFSKPFVLLTRQDSSLKVFFIQLSSRWIALSVWATYSLMAIAVLTWIRSSMSENNDPVTLLLSGLSGNFLYDPQDGKNIVARVTGLVWLAVSLWAFLQRDKDARINDELDAELKSL